ncbi:MAG: DNA translocase FtsK 4TM domain-containing protein [Patescibacteria group bacterium]
MAQKNKKDKKKNQRRKEQEILDLEEKKESRSLHPETKKSVLGVIFITLALISFLAYFGYAGIAGEYINKALTVLLGVGFFVVPLTFLMIAIAFFKSLKTNLYLTVIFGGAVFFLSFLGLIDVLSKQLSSSEDLRAGWIGFITSYPFYHFFGFWVSIVAFIALMLISFAMIFNVPIRVALKQKMEEVEDVIDGEDSNEYIEDEDEYSEDDEKDAFDAGFISKAIASSKKSVDNFINKKEDIKKVEKPVVNTTNIINPSKAVSDFIVETHQRSYKLPPLNLLDNEQGKPSAGDAKAYSETIKRTLKNFGIEVDMGEVSVGPTVTQYTLKPAQGIKLSKIIALQNDLSLALAAHPLRIEAPIPGKSLVGIEIPNKIIAIVKLRKLLDTPAFIESSPLTISLGKDVSGNAQYADIERMPHLLIAGATGSGKSVCVHTILNSLLYKNFPQMLKLLMIDPKRVELVAYNGIPHLLAPVINERKKAIAALNWAVKEMERRYEFLAEHDVRNIGSYNSKVTGKTDEKIMPYVVIIVDELADLMSESAREVEAAIVRLAQMSRAVGIHLIISTQRPSVDVITGLIKANMPCRIALQVTSLVDSRTILDMSGAEKLLGSGDMLYLPQDASKPRRIQNAFITEKEVKRVTDYLKNEARQSDSLDEENNIDSNDLKNALERKNSTIDMNIDLDSFTSSSNDDELFEDARQIVIDSQKASTSFLQRRLKIGYSRAARLIDMLEDDGIVGPADGAKAREVYITKEEGYGKE